MQVRNFAKHRSNIDSCILAARPTSEMGSDEAWRPMPTEIQGSRDKTYLDTSSSWPSEGTHSVRWNTVMRKDEPVPTEWDKDANKVS